MSIHQRGTFELDSQIAESSARELLAPPAAAPFPWRFVLAALAVAALGSTAFLLYNSASSPPSGPSGPSLPELSDSYTCESDLQLGPVSKTEKKGLCLDDTTWSECASKIPRFWPNTDDRVTSLRLFSPWKDTWPEDAREDAWNNLHEYLEANDVKILLGTEITCDTEANARMWEWTKQLISKIGVHRLMGLAIGNELDLLNFKKPKFNPPGCMERLWSETNPDSFVQIFLSRVEELDKSMPGFTDIPVMTVWSTYCFAHEPFLDNPQQAMCKTFFIKAIEKYGTRFVFAFNIYPYFDIGNHLDPDTLDQCQGALEGKLCFHHGCFMNRVAAEGRLKINSLTGSMQRPSDEKYQLWTAESGWSYPYSSTTQEAMKFCPAWSSKETFIKSYDGWLKWDLSLDFGFQPADHAFYFTMRDSYNFEEEEHFGLVAGCDDLKCKMQQIPTTTTTTIPSTTTTTTTRLSTTTTTRTRGKDALYTCKSDLELGPVSQFRNKGLCLDDTTFSTCASEIPQFYPNTKERVTSLRLFAPWKEEWPEDAREEAWNQLHKYIEVNDAKILLGCEITCFPEKDAQVWAWTKELISKIGAHRLMGLAIGNEMDLLHFKTPNFRPPGCMERLWSNQDDPNSFVQIFLSRIEELDKSVAGFSDVPVTSVWSLYCYAAEPFFDHPHQVMCKSFFERAIRKYGTRFVFAFNVYPYFAPDNHIDWGTTDQCKQSLGGKLCFTNGCFTNRLASQGRHKINHLLREMQPQRPGDEKYQLWMGESGWSHPVSSTTQRAMKDCPEWNSKETFKTNYDGWLKWDLSLEPSVPPVDHAFFFTMRDAFNFGEEEHFGLVAKCSDDHCKLQQHESSLSAMIE